jgi:hypothetical protein
MILKESSFTRLLYALKAIPLRRGGDEKVSQKKK